MNRLSRLLLCFLFLLAPLAVFAEETPAATTPLLAEIQRVASSAHGIAGTGKPAIGLKQSCTADQTCANQCPSLHCDGVTSCTTTATSVTCDGNTFTCEFPTCTPPSGCLAQGTGCDWCDCRAQGGTIFQCHFICLP